MLDKLEKSEETAAEAKKASESWLGSDGYVSDRGRLNFRALLLHTLAHKDQFAAALRKAEEDLKAKSEAFRVHASGTYCYRRF